MANRTISFHLGMLVVMVAVPLLLLAIGLLVWSAALARHTVDRGLRETARVLAVAVEREIATSAAALYALAAAPQLDCTPTPRFYNQARMVGMRHGGWIVLADAQGQQRMNTLRPFGARLPAVPESPLAQAPAREDRPFVSDVLLGSVVGEAVVFVAVPLVRAGQAPCWLGMSFGPERFGALVRLPGNGSSWSGILTDGRHTVIAPSAEDGIAGSRAPEWYMAATASRDRGLVNGEWPDQGPVRLAYERVSEGRWTVAVAAPRTEFYSAWVWPVVVGTLGSLLVIGVAVSVAAGYARRMKRQVDRLVGQAAKVGEGPPAASAPGFSSVAELATLEKVLARADGDVRERRVEHERRMASEALRAAAESASRSKDLFLATLSHELRGPLTAVIGWLDLAHQSLDDRTTLRNALDIALRNARQQARIIEDLLDMSRIVSGKFRVERHPMDPGRLVREAVEACRPAAEEKAVELRCTVGEGEPALIHGDRQRMHQALGNLIGNAIKFNHPGGWVDVTLERRGAELRLAVADNGEGIASEARAQIFERFWQANSGSSRKHAGLGLGLPLVRHIVELHDGRIWVDSDGPGRGARFSVQLPALAASAQLAPVEDGPPAQAGESGLAGVAVLAVDDDDDTLGWLELALARHGALTWSACSADEAVALLDRVRPQVLISDLAMPGRDGYDLIRSIRARPNAGRIAALALSGQATEDSRARALASGYDAFIAKPCDSSTLLAAVAALVRKNAAVESK